MSREKLEKMVLTALFFALIMAMAFIPNVGYIKYIPGVPQITTLHVVVIIGAALLGPWYGALIGGFFGASSFIYAIINMSPDNMPFVNPLVSIFPRIMVGMLAGLCFNGIQKLFSKKTGHAGNVIAAVISGIVGTLTNTVLVLTMLTVFGHLISLGALVENLINWIIMLNGVLELILAAVLVPAIGIPVYYFMQKSKTKSAG